MKDFLSPMLSYVRFFVVLLFISSLVIPAFAQEKPVVISIGQPNIWSLEQAHYLLARMHRQNLDLQTAPLGSIDPNATNSTRIDIVKMLISGGFSFDEALGLNNDFLKKDKDFNSSRRRQLLEQRSQLLAQRTKIAGQITDLKIAQAQTKDDKEKEMLQAQINARIEERDAVDNQLAAVNSEVNGLTSASGNFSSVDASKLDGFDAGKLPSGSLSALLPKETDKPSIAASQKLENYVGMQYEIIAKQLTLLRDEVGPGERLVFLELPQSINLSQDQEKNKYYQALRGITGMSTNDSADNKMAQVWWRIAGYTKVNEETLFEQEAKTIREQIIKIQDALKAEFPTSPTNEDDQVILNALNDGRSKLERRLAKQCRDQIDLKKKRDELDKEIKRLRSTSEKADSELNQKKKLLEEEQNKPILDTVRIDKLKEEIRPLQETADTARSNLNQKETVDCATIDTDLDLLGNTIKQTEAALQVMQNRELIHGKEEAKLYADLAALYSKYERLTVQAERNRIQKQRDAVDRLWQGGSQTTATVVKNTLELLRKNGGAEKSSEKVENTTETTGSQLGSPDKKSDKMSSREFIELTREDTFTPKPDRVGVTKADTNRAAETGRRNHPSGLLRDRSVRIVDIIPRQSAVNVDTTKESVKASGVVAAFSFLFGFGGNVRYQRQKETFDEFVNQELYTSGFGKGDTDFGWSFFPFNGSKQLAPGLRTTYAVAIVPDDAESLVLKAQGCYFPRRQKQPGNYDAANRWQTDKESNGCLEREQIFVIPVPGGSGRGSDFYITEVRYKGGLAPGQRMIASILGQNISPQTGVTIEGVPLSQAVGLAQTGIESIIGDKVRENCEGPICGRFERISSTQLVISFKMPDGYKGIPRIGLTAPGKAVEINALNLNINGKEDVKLEDADFMFGNRPGPGAERILTDFRAAIDPTDATKTLGILTGKFGENDTFYINGKLASIEKEAKGLRIISFTTQATDQLTITLVPTSGDSISKFVSNPSEPRIISTTVADVVRDGTIATVTVVINGTGFGSPGMVYVDGTALPPANVINASTGQLVLRVTTNKAIFAVDIEDATNKKTVRTMVQVPPAIQIPEGN